VLTVIITENSSAHLSDSKSFTVTVREVNTAPVLTSISDGGVNAGMMIRFTNSATDADIPANNLVFNLATAPAGASVTPDSGIFTWRPGVSKAGTTNSITVRVTDDGSPPLFDSKSFTVVVNPLSEVELTPLPRTNGYFVMGVSGDVGPDYNIQVSTNLTNWTLLQTVTPTSTPFTFTDTNAASFGRRFYRVLLGP
jgi:hypothetical protein